MGSTDREPGGKRTELQEHLIDANQAHYAHIYAKYEDRVKSYCIIMDASDSLLNKINK
jgi:hypothetical protein